MKTETQSIEKTLVPANERLDFLPHFTGNHFMTYESMIYTKMGEFAPEYNGGFWDYYTLSNGGFFMSLDEDKRFSVDCASNYYQGEMSAEALSIGVNLLVQNAFAWQIDSEKFSEAFHRLRYFAIEHKECSEIMGFIN
jgi:hypothetical protein